MLNACIVGCGGIYHQHAKAVSAIAAARLAAVCDVRKERADEAARLYNCRPLYHFDEVLMDPAIDVIHICTPHHLHAHMTCQALRAGKQVVLEKPVAISEKELLAMIRAEKETDNHVCITLQNRTNRSVETMMHIMKTDKSIGKLIGITGLLLWKRDEAYYTQEPPWRGRWYTEGGSLMANQAVHTLDLMHLFAGPARRVRSVLSNLTLENIIETEDTAHVIIDFENDVRGVFFGTNTYTTTNPASLELDFENVRFRYADGSLYRIEPKKEAALIAKDEKPTGAKQVWGSGHGRVILDFYTFLSEGGAYLSLTDALPSAKTLLALYESGKTGSPWINVK